MKSRVAPRKSELKVFKGEQRFHKVRQLFPLASCEYSVKSTQDLLLFPGKTVMLRLFTISTAMLALRETGG